MKLIHNIQDNRIGDAVTLIICVKTVQEVNWKTTCFKKQQTQTFLRNLFVGTGSIIVVTTFDCIFWSKNFFYPVSKISFLPKFREDWFSFSKSILNENCKILTETLSTRVFGPKGFDGYPLPRIRCTPSHYRRL